MSLPSTAVTISTPNNKRLQRTSNPTPSEREDSKKSRRNNSNSSKQIWKRVNWMILYNLR